MYQHTVPFTTVLTECKLYATYEDDGSVDFTVRSAPLGLFALRHAATLPAAKRMMTMFERRCKRLYEGKRLPGERLVFNREY